MYGFVTYTSLLMLIISTIYKVNFIESQATARAIYLIPGIVCSAILATSGVNITLETVSTVNITNDTVANQTIFYESADTTSAFILLNPIWQTVHIMFMFILLVYVIVQMLQLFGLYPKRTER